MNYIVALVLVINNCITVNFHLWLSYIMMKLNKLS